MEFLCNEEKDTEQADDEIFVGSGSCVKVVVEEIV